MNSIFNFYFAFNFSLDENRSIENRIGSVDEGTIRLDNVARQKVFQLVVDSVTVLQSFYLKN